MGVYKGKAKKQRATRGLSGTSRNAPGLNFRAGVSAGPGFGGYALTNHDLLGHRACK